MISVKPQFLNQLVLINQYLLKVQMEPLIVSKEKIKIIKTY